MSAGRCFRQSAAVVWMLTATVGAHDLTRYDPGPQNWDELAHAWSFEPGVTFPLLLAAYLYARGTRRLWQATRPGRGFEVMAFAAGWLTLVVALVSPLHPWGQALFAAHMTQHELLMLVAAPLLVLGRPMVPFLWAFHGKAARALGRAMNAIARSRFAETFTNPLSAWFLHAAILWAWHIPALFQATLQSSFIHALQHSSFLGSALLFWWAIVHGRQRGLGYGAAVLYLFTTALHSGLLGALLTFTRHEWYPLYRDTGPAWGLTPLEDQQLGGLIMWIPAGVVYIVAGLALFAGWLREAELRSRAASTVPVNPAS